jgi:hypothetical protein
MLTARLPIDQPGLRDCVTVPDVIADADPHFQLANVNDSSSIAAPPDATVNVNVPNSAVALQVPD